MNKTDIEWVKNPDGSQGYTWNPITGCLNGCSYCYARKLANGRLKKVYYRNYEVAPMCGHNHLELRAGGRSDSRYSDPFYPRFWPERIEQGMLGESHNPRGVFTCDMSDLFGIGIPDDWTERVLNVIKWNESDRFYLLTKQPQNLQKFSPFPDNCWVGVSATDYDMMLEALNALCEIKASVIYLSLEPLLSWEHRYDWSVLRDTFEAQQLDWIIIGAQTKPTRYPKIEWIQEIAKAADLANVPLFIKDNLKPFIESQDPLNSQLWHDICNDERGHERVSDDLKQDHPVDRVALTRIYKPYLPEVPDVQ